MMEDTSANGSRMIPIKRKSIFTDIVHLAGLNESNKASGRETVLDLRTTKQSIINQRSDTSQTFNQKSSSIASLLDRHHSFNPFLPTSFLTPDPFGSSILPPPHAFQEFLPSTVFGSQPGPEGMPVWPGGPYGQPNTLFPSLSFRSQFAPISYNNMVPTVTGRQERSSICPTVGPVKVPSLQPRTKQAPRFQCPDCTRVYSTFSGLSKHRQFHCTAQLKRQFGCKFCQKHYTSLGALKMHIRTHTLPCKCDLCGKAFSRPWLLQGHVRTHTGEKPFRCLHCGRAFADRSNLRAHLQTHSDVKKYRCVCCQKTFSRMSLLTKHESNGCSGLANI